MSERSAGHFPDSRVPIHSFHSLGIIPARPHLSKWTSLGSCGEARHDIPPALPPLPPLAPPPYLNASPPTRLNLFISVATALFLFLFSSNKQPYLPLPSSCLAAINNHFSLRTGWLTHTLDIRLAGWHRCVHIWKQCVQARDSDWKLRTWGIILPLFHSCFGIQRAMRSKYNIIQCAHVGWNKQATWCWFSRR